jgi:predicted lipoprotein
MRARLLLLFAATLALSFPARADSVFESLNRQLTDRVVIPGYRGFADAAAGLGTVIAAFCAAPDPAHLADARLAFEQALDAWERVQPIVFGPARAGGRTMIIQMFPDAREAVSRQLAKALAAKEPALIAAGGLDGKSVALTGFPALEQILYDDARLPAPGASSAEADYACALAAAIGRNLALQANRLLDDWQRPGGFRDAVLSAEAGNDFYQSADEATGDYLKSLHTALQAIIVIKLEEPLGKSLDGAKPMHAENWRSERSLADIRANLETARALYVSPRGFGDALRALTDEEQLDSALRQGFERAFAKLDAIGEPLHKAVEDPAARPKVEALVSEVKAQRQLIARELAPALDLAIGFNALDGD